MRAVKFLNADEGAAGQIARLLRLAEKPETAKTPTHVDVPERPQSEGKRTGDIGERPEFKSVEQKPIETPKSDSAANQEEEPSIPADLITLDPLDLSPPKTFAAIPTLPEEPHALSQFEPIQLFFPLQTRGILSRVLARRTHTGPWDLRELVNRAGKGESLSTIPQLPQPSLARGVQLLIDRSPALAVYSEDQNWLQQKIEKVVGHTNVTTLEFEGNPLRVFDADDPLKSDSYIERHLPPPGTVVAALTDLGIGNPGVLYPRAKASDWLEFSDHLRRRACPVVAFVPYGAARWPTALRKFLTIIHWDWTTNTASIHAIAGKGLVAHC